MTPASESLISRSALLLLLLLLLLLPPPPLRRIPRLPGAHPFRRLAPRQVLLPGARRPPV
jgi:hypothetical protein